MSDKRRILAQDYGYALQNEFLIASSAKEGYFREFKIPQRLEGFSYSFQVNNNSLSLNYSDSLVYFALPDHSGQLVVGKNNIQNINGTICVNC